MDARARKRELRDHYLALRESLTAGQIETASREIFNNLKQLAAINTANTIHCYLSIRERGEVDTAAIIDWLLESGKQVIVPKTDFGRNELRHFVLDDADTLTVNKWGIPEPQGGREVGESLPDIVLVPMVAADRERNRIGYGKGFYDRFLSKTDALKIGLVYEACITGEPIPVEPFDVVLDLLVTETGVL